MRSSLLFHLYLLIWNDGETVFAQGLREEHSPIPTDQATKVIASGAAIRQVKSYYEFHTMAFQPLSVHVPQPPTLPSVVTSHNNNSLFKGTQLATVQKLQKLMDQFVQEPKIQRARRFLDHGLLPFVGWIQQKIGGVARVQDIDDLKVQSNQLSAHVSAVQQVVQTQNDDLKILFRDVRNISLEIEDIKQKALSEIDKDLVGLHNSMIEIADEASFLGWYTTSLGAMLFELIHYLQLESQVYSIKASCENGFLSPLLLSRTALRSLLTTTLKTIQESAPSLELSIPLNHLDWYYKYPLAHCMHSYDEFIVTVSFPLLHVNTPTLLYQFNFFPFVLQGRHVSVWPRDQEYVFERKNRAGVATFAQTICLTESPTVLDFCLVKFGADSLYSDNNCLSQILHGGSISLLKTACPLHHLPQSSLWKVINETALLYLGPKTVISVCAPTCLQYSLGGTSFASLLQIPCGGYISSIEGIRYYGQLVCDEDKIFPIQEWIPFHLITYDQLQLPSSIDVPSLTLTNTESVINDSFKLRDYLHELDQLRLNDEILAQKVPVIDWTSPYHSGWYYFFIALLTVAALGVGIWAYRRWKYYSLLAPALSLIPSVKATSPIASVEVAFEGIMWISCLILLAFIYFLLKKMAAKLQCHHYKTLDLWPTGSHIDILIPYGETTLKVGLTNCIRLRTPPATVQGSVTITDATLVVQDFPYLMDYRGSMLNVNRSYKIKPGQLPKCSGITSYLEYPTN